MEIITQAVAADNADELDQALSLYKQGLNYLVTGLKYVKSDKNKAIIREKVGQYMNRAEQLQEMISKRSSKSMVTASGGGEKNTKKDGGDEDADPDTAKLMASLEGAIVKEKPNVKWDDVAGLDGAKKLLKEAVILPVKFPQLFQGAVKPWKGILLYGPPGTGKSYLAKALATEAGSCFLSVSSSDLVSKYQGESERLVRNLFELARKNAPSIIFIDEVDSLCSARGEGENESSRRIKTEFLVQMQGVGKNSDGVLVLGATNVPWELDSAIRRRFEKRVYIPLPEAAARAAMFRIHIGDTPHSLTDADFAQLAKMTEGFQGADISICVREALYAPVRMCQDATHFKKVQDPQGQQEYMWTPCSPGDKGAQEMTLYDIDGEHLLPPPLSFKHFAMACQKTKPAVSPDDLGQQEEWTALFGMEG
jgi:vacuolar protein-sorting-associated protein 4